MTLRPLGIIGLILWTVACGYSPPDESRPADADQLRVMTGAWTLHLRTDGQERRTWPWPHTLVVPAQIHVRPTRDSAGIAVRCPGCLSGKASIPPPTRPLRVAFPDSIKGYLDADGRLLLLIGACCDRGEWALLGRLRSGEVHGRWYQTFISTEHSARGSYRLVRSSM
jgi:hypothetical protein